MATAFQTLLSNVSDMGLNEGDFLRMNNLLKKAYDEDKKDPKIIETQSRPIDMSFFLKDTLDKRVLEIHISEITRRFEPDYPNQPFAALRLVSINGYFKTDDHTSPLTFTKEVELWNFVRFWIQRVRPMTITVATGRPAIIPGGFQTNYTYKNVLASCKAEDEADIDDDDDDDCCYDYAYMFVMGHRFLDMLLHMLRAMES
jgi:hypothetical protein